eukprot:2061266-Amphidinium_carterae.2
MQICVARCALLILALLAKRSKPTLSHNKGLRCPLITCIYKHKANGIGRIGNLNHNQGLMDEGCQTSVAFPGNPTPFPGLTQKHTMQQNSRMKMQLQVTLERVLQDSSRSPLAAKHFIT